MKELETKELEVARKVWREVHECGQCVREGESERGVRCFRVILELERVRSESE